MNVSGETNLDVLLKSMKPTLVEGVYVFVTLQGKQLSDAAELQPKAMFMEDEGMTLVIPQTMAQKHGYDCSSPFRCITLTVHSSLEAVGLTAAFSNKLKAHNISANVMAGYYHDHIFVQSGKSAAAMAALQEFSRLN